MKQYVGKMSDDHIFSTMLRLTSESRQQRQIQMKFFPRFWHSMDTYNQGKSHDEILHLV